jgi:hypothetical protein
METLTELTMCDDGINYFDFASCVAELAETEHLRINDAGKYSLTDKGRRNGEITENNLPYSVRMKAEESCAVLRADMSRNALIKTVHKNNGDGSVTVTLALSDGIGEIASIKLFAASEDQALDLEKGFRKNAEKIYNELIKLILEL